MMPTLRLKKRYIQFEIIGPHATDVSETEARDELFKTFQAFFGEEEYGTAAFLILLGVSAVAFLP